MVYSEVLAVSPKNMGLGQTGHTLPKLISVILIGVRASLFTIDIFSRGLAYHLMMTQVSGEKQFLASDALRSSEAQSTVFQVDFSPASFLCDSGPPRDADVILPVSFSKKPGFLVLS